MIHPSSGAPMRTIVYKFHQLLDGAAKLLYLFASGEIYIYINKTLTNDY